MVKANDLRRSINDFTSETTAYAWWFMLIPTLVMLIIGMVCFVFPAMAGFGSIMVTGVVLLFELIIHAAYGASFNEQEAKRNTLWIKAGSILFLLHIILCPFLFLASKTGNRALALVALLFFLPPIFFIVLWASRSDKTKHLWDTVEKMSFKEVGGSDNEHKAGDVLLCETIEDKEKDQQSHHGMAKGFFAEKSEPVYIPYKDRFVHMLILGPTGGGKTSQILLPMIRQDLQNKEAGLIVMDPKGDLARSVYFMSKFYDRPAKLFDPELDTCPHFNPLAGREDRVVANMQKTFTIMMADSSDYFQNMTAQCVGNAAYLLKRLDRFYGQPGKFATLLNMSAIIQNIGDEGEALLKEFKRVMDAPNFAMDNNERRQNLEIFSYFREKYYAERSKEFEACSGLRSNLSALCSNEYLRNVLNPDVTKGEKNDIDFDKALEDGEVLCISTAQGLLGNMSGFIGYFLTLQLQACVLRRPGNEDTRRPCFLYIDEFQTYANMGFSDMLTQGRSYRVACHLATQARAQIGMNAGRDGKTFTDLVSTNARSVVIFPGVSPDDAVYYSKKFGEYEKETLEIGITRKKFDLLSGGFSSLGHPSENIRTNRKMTANFTPTEIMYRPFGEITYSIMQNNTLMPARAGKVKYIPSDLKAYIDQNIVSYVSEHRKLSADEMFEKKREDDAKGFMMEDKPLNDDGSSQEKKSSGGGISNGPSVISDPIDLSFDIGDDEDADTAAASDTKVKNVVIESVSVSRNDPSVPPPVFGAAEEILDEEI